MAKNTTRDQIWNATLQLAEEKKDEGTWSRRFTWEDVVQRLEAEPSNRTIRDTLSTIAEMGWIKKSHHQGKYEPLEPDNDSETNGE
ncbi:hypothetical protein CP556_25050 [Natrinema sp. CBA1119]|uniref:hypothetical protein n=1 Tax=Natrinema sp. CBA1119 TaxID=1608465 RepID=UPI000BF34607|nr:hypothetical protein [Natrinema sp. CBA1119]PGF13799.1 hypothetical protein CP556_25050 [Natrinema sp. CBA1119]